MLFKCYPFNQVRGHGLLCTVGKRSYISELGKSYGQLHSQASFNHGKKPSCISFGGEWVTLVVVVVDDDDDDDDDLHNHPCVC